MNLCIHQHIWIIYWHVILRIPYVMIYFIITKLCIWPQSFFYFLIVKWTSKKYILSYRNWLDCSYAWKRFMVHLPSYHQGRVKKVSYLYSKIYIAKGMFQNTLRNKIWSRTSCDMYLNSRPVKGLSRPLFPNRKQIPSRRKYFILGLVIIHIDWAHDT